MFQHPKSARSFSTPSERSLDSSTQDGPDLAVI